MIERAAASLLLLLALPAAGAGGAEPPRLEKATFAGGCFWCMQAPFDRLPGVVETSVGYTGGQKAAPTYEEVSSGRTGHAEAVEIHFDPARIGYGQLLDTFWRSIDPTQSQGQFVDRGSQYRTAVFYHGEEQKRRALDSKAALAKSGRFDGPIVTEIVPAARFWRAEEYHQKYYLKARRDYERYRTGSGRDDYLKKTWGEAAAPVAETDSEWRKILSPDQFYILRKRGTERPFSGEYVHHAEPGIYLCAADGHALFASEQKFDSGTGWPSFWAPIRPAAVVTAEDAGFFTRRTEVLCPVCGGHLGHVFDDGPSPTGKRYCINSAALRFQPGPREPAARRP
ncbi:MAG: peptide-methionine (S)-S-oxide reductase MsrA [Elusimicrobia bacterium]|nr:peptide-methionine (S)-S-oxide reductase MsrA [Elusimicrobiota bacterium]